MNYAIKDFLKTRLHLETSDRKIKGCELKEKLFRVSWVFNESHKKRKTRFGYVAKSDMTKKAKSNALIKIKEAIKAIQKKPMCSNRLAL